MKNFTVRDIPDAEHRALRIKAAENETSINQTILDAIKNHVRKEDEKENN